MLAQPRWNVASAAAGYEDLQRTCIVGIGLASGKAGAPIVLDRNVRNHGPTRIWILFILLFDFNGSSVLNRGQRRDRAPKPVLHRGLKKLLPKQVVQQMWPVPMPQ